jgi:hypothetical protein
MNRSTDVRRRRIVHPILEARVSMKAASCVGIDNTKSSIYLLFLFTSANIQLFLEIHSFFAKKIQSYIQMLSLDYQLDDLQTKNTASGISSFLFQDEFDNVQLMFTKNLG